MLRLEAVNAGYGSTTVLRDVSLWVPPSSVVAYGIDFLRFVASLDHMAAARPNDTLPP